MGFWDNLFDNEYKQRADINHLRKMASARGLAQTRTSTQVLKQEERIEQLEEQVGELALLCRSLLTLLRENGTVDPEQFQEVLHRLDAEDGMVDGKISESKPPVEEQEPPEPPPKPRRLRF